MSMTPKGWSLSALEVELGYDRRTIAKRIREASLRPVETEGKTKLYRLADVVQAIERHAAQLRTPPSASARGRLSMIDAADAVLFLRSMDSSALESPPGMVASWDELAGMLDIDDTELRAWVRFGCPYMEHGDPKTGEGFRFSLGHVLRWCGLFFAALQHNKLVGSGDPMRCAHLLPNTE